MPRWLLAARATLVFLTLLEDQGHRAGEWRLAHSQQGPSPTRALSNMDSSCMQWLQHLPDRSRQVAGEALEGAADGAKACVQLIGLGQAPHSKPPSTAMSAPVMKSDAELARNAAIPAKSSGVPRRPAAVRARTRSFNAVMACRRLVMSVSM